MYCTWLTLERGNPFPSLYKTLLILSQHCIFYHLYVVSLTSLVSNQHLRSHPETMIIELVADVIGFGMGLGGGATEYGNLPVVISHIEPDGPAGV